MNQSGSQGLRVWLLAVWVRLASISISPAPNLDEMPEPFAALNYSYDW